MNEPLTFGQWMKRRRAELDLTQQALAGELGCAVQTIRTFEIGTRRPSRALAERLADALALPAAQRADFVRLARAPVGRVIAGAADQDPPSDERAAAPASDSAAGGSSARRQAAIQEAVATQPALLRTKLYVPQPRADLVPRPRLHARLERGLAGQLTVIAAPAGSGKTTLLADWLAAKQGLAEFGIENAELRKENISHFSIRHSQFRCAWLSLDSTDNDPLQFLRYVVAALQTVAPAVGRSATALLHAAQTPPIEMLLTLLINDLIALPDQTVLVLDDYHTVDAPAVHQALAFLLEHLPVHVHLVIATRVDPPLALSRLRARGQLVELRVADLRFTPDEAALFLGEIMGLALPAADVAALEAHTEGWIAGLQLAALSLQNRPPDQRAEFIAAFAGSHRFVVDYLIDEVLARQPAHRQAFLLQTAILERLCGSLCDAVILGELRQAPHTGAMGDQTYSQALLEELEHANLFLLPLDDQRRWYRYHHLFAEVLRERLTSGVSQDTVATLHGRASAWFEQQGMVVEAVQHALNARDWEGAARLIEAHGQLLLARGQIQTVLGWLNALPETVARAHPFLDVIHAGALFNVNQLDAAERRLQVVGQSFSAGTHHDHSAVALGTTTLIRAYIALFRGDLVNWLSLARQALEMLPATAEIGRTAANLDLASAFLLSGEVTPANERSLVAAVAAVREIGDLSTLFRGIVTLAALQRCQGRLRQAAATYAEAAHVLADPILLQTIPNGANYYFGLGGVLRESNDLDGAEELLTQGRAVVRRMRLAEAASITDGYVALARLYQARGAHDDAIATLQELEAVAHQRSFAAQLATRARAARAEAALRHGDLDAAVAWAETSNVQPTGELSYAGEPEYLALARVRIAQAQRDRAGPHVHEVLQLLERLLGTAESVGRRHSVIEILILRALALQAQADRPGALAALERALILAAPEGCVRIFVDEGASLALLLGHRVTVTEWRNGAGPHDHDVRAYAQQILAVFAAEGIGPRGGNVPAMESRAPIPGGEVLTARELEVLRLLASGRSNAAIAAELIVAIGTVKRHVNSIMGKLQAHSRLEAVARARALDLV